MHTTNMDDLRFWVRDVRRRCADHHISVRFQHGLDTAHATKSEIVIPAPELPMSYEDFCLLRYYALHEVGHHLRPECFDLLDKNKMTKDYFGVWNAVEDELQEDEVRRGFRGDRKTLIVGRDIHNARQLAAARKARAANPGEEFDEDTCKRVAAHMVCQTMRKDWHPNIMHTIDSVLDVIGARARELYDTLMAEGWGERMVPMSPREGMEFSIEFARRLWPEQEQPEEEPEGEGGNGEGEEGEGEGNSSQEHGNEGEDEAKSRGTMTIPWTELMHDNHEDKNKPTPKRTGDPQIDWTGWSPGGDVVYYPDDQIKYIPPEKLRISHVGWHHYAPDSSFANQLRRHIQSTHKVGWETNRLTGKRINKRALKRIVTGTREYNRRIFSRKNEAPALNTCVTVLVDWSGSMCGSPANLAINAAATLVECFERVLGVPVEVLAHTTSGDKLKIYGVKPYGDRASGKEVFDRLTGQDQSGNADGDALLFAYDRIIKRPEKRKVIISLADGEPADCYNWSADPGTILHRTIEHIRSTNVELYGIGILHEGIKRWYGEDSEVVKRVEELPHVLLEAAKKFVVPKN